MSMQFHIVVYLMPEHKRSPTVTRLQLVKEEEELSEEDVVNFDTYFACSKHVYYKFFLVFRS